MMETTRELRFEEVVTIRRIVAAGALLMITSLTALGLSTAHGAPAGWGDDLRAGIDAASAQGRPLVVLVGTSGCAACASQEAELRKPSVKRALADAVKVRVEAADYPKFTSRHASGGTPTTVVFAPATGYAEPVFTNTGVLTARELNALGRSLSSMVLASD